MLLIILTPGLATATPVIWGDNGNYYEVWEIAAVQQAMSQTNITWEEARDWAATLTHVTGGQTYVGHLATITSADENDFIRTVASGGSSTAYILGGYQTPSDPELNFSAAIFFVMIVVRSQPAPVSVTDLSILRRSSYTPGPIWISAPSLAASIAS